MRPFRFLANRAINLKGLLVKQATYQKYSGVAKASYIAYFCNELIITFRFVLDSTSTTLSVTARTDNLKAKKQEQ